MNGHPENTEIPFFLSMLHVNQLTGKPSIWYTLTSGTFLTTQERKHATLYDAFNAPDTFRDKHFQNKTMPTLHAKRLMTLN